VARRRGLSIGGVLARLTPEFPDLTISKLRFLETEGLVTPSRAPSGYRIYTEADVHRLHYVLTAQRDRFWPLKVIRDALDAMDRGLTPAADAPGERPRVPGPLPDPDVPPAEILVAPASLRLTEAELVDAGGLDPEMFQALRGFHLVRPDASGHYDDAALAVVRAAAALAAYGVEARHLRPFRTAADREVGLVQQIVVPAMAAAGSRAATGTNPTGAKNADPTAEVLHHCLALHAALVRAALRGG